MPGTVCDMPVKEFFKRLLVHFALASAVCYGVLVALERLIPGFVSPFVDLAQMGWCVLVVLAVALVLARRPTKRWTMAFAIALFVFVAIVCLTFLYSRINDLGNWGLGLIGCAVILGGLTIYALWFAEVAD